MTSQADILGRPPIMRPITHPEADQTRENWRGDDIIKNVPRHQHGGTCFRLNGQSFKISKAKAPARRTTGPQCALDGCTRTLNHRNKSGVCKEHMHSDACLCPPCVNRRERGRK